MGTAKKKCQLQIDQFVVLVEFLDEVWQNLCQFPLKKFSLFVPTAYWRTRSNKTEKPLFLSQYQDFCAKIKSLNSKWPKVFENFDASDMKELISGKKITDVYRRAKFIIFQLQ